MYFLLYNKLSLPHEPLCSREVLPSLSQGNWVTSGGIGVEEVVKLSLLWGKYSLYSGFSSLVPFLILGCHVSAENASVLAVLFQGLVFISLMPTANQACKCRLTCHSSRSSWNPSAGSDFAVPWGDLSGCLRSRQLPWSLPLYDPGAPGCTSTYGAFSDPCFFSCLNIKTLGSFSETPADSLFLPYTFFCSGFLIFKSTYGH